MKFVSKLLLLGAVAAAGGSLQAQTTGFTGTAAGPYDYDNASNWVGEVINGIWDSSLTLTATQAVTFDSDLELETGFTFTYGGAFSTTLRGDSVANRTITLGGDILVNTASANRTITFGSTTALQKLNVDLGDEIRILDVRAAAGNNNQRSLTFINNISNGGLVLQGGGNVNLSGGSTSLSTVSLTSLTVKNSHLNASAYSDIAVSGALTIDGAGGLNASGNTGGIAIITMGNASARNHTLTASSLQRENGGVVLFRGPNLGASAPGTNNSTNITFSTAPTAQLVGGGGAAGSTNVSIIPWALGGTTTSDFSTFVTYDAVKGIRPLDVATEFASSIADGVVSTNNVRLAAGSGSTTITANTTVNSLYMVGDDTTATVLAGSGTLTVTSGAVYMGIANTNTAINASLNFAEAQGVIGYGSGKSSQINAAIAGSNGLVLYQNTSFATPGSPGTGVAIAGNAASSTYSGDTYILGRAAVNVAGFLPYDTRTGDVYVYGILEVGPSMTINGLNGSGVVSKGSGSGTITLGDNDANGAFSGSIIQVGTTTLRKIGAGTQVLSGSSAHTGATLVTEGTLVVDGVFAGAGAVTVSEGANLGGSGSLNGLVTTVGIGSTISPGSSPGTLTLAGGLNASAGATFVFELGTSADVLNLGSGVLTGSTAAGGMVFNFSNSGGLLANNPYTIMTFGSSSNLDYSDFMAAILPSGYVLDTDFGTNGFQINGTSLQVQFDMVPEPSAALLGGLGMACLLWRSRRRN